MSGLLTFSEMAAVAAVFPEGSRADGGNRMRAVGSRQRVPGQRKAGAAGRHRSAEVSAVEGELNVGDADVIRGVGREGDGPRDRRSGGGGNPGNGGRRGVGNDGGARHDELVDHVVQRVEPSVGAVIGCPQVQHGGAAPVRVSRFAVGGRLDEHVVEVQLARGAVPSQRHFQQDARAEQRLFGSLRNEIEERDVVSGAVGEQEIAVADRGLEIEQVVVGAGVVDGEGVARGRR